MTDKVTELPQDNTIKGLLIRNKIKIQQSLPDHVDVDHFINSALLAVARSPEAAKCSAKSLFTAIVNAAETGLDFTPAKGHAYLVPYKGTLVFMPGYRGLIHLLHNTGLVKKMAAHIVYENDVFEIAHGHDETLIHKPHTTGDHGGILGAYAIIWFKDGSVQHEWMTKKDIDAVMAIAKTKNVWSKHYGEMARKSVIRRLFKYVPSSPSIDKAVEHDNLLTNEVDGKIDATDKSRTESLVDTICNANPQPENAEDADFTDVEPKDDPLPEVQSDDVSFMDDAFVK